MNKNSIILFLFSLTIFVSYSQESIQDTTVQLSKSNSGIDSVVTMSSTDSVSFNVKSKIMRLRGDAKLDYKTQKINSEIIEISFDDAILIAYGVEDSTGVIEGFPVFNDMGEEFAGKEIKFNFKTSKGIIALGETELSEGFYYGEKIKKIDETSFFVSEGRYTTCDAPQPHYYFGSPEMKVEAGNKVFLDPIILYVENIPVFIIPFGLFFPNTGGRQSGLIVPTFYFSRSRGVVLQDLGFYWAASDYWDTQLKVDFFSKGGYLFKNFSRFKYQDLISGNLNLEYGRNKLNYDDPFATNWAARGDYRHTINPSTSISANFNFASSNFFQNTSTINQERVTQNLNSQFGLNKSFQNGSNLSLSYSRNENIIDGTYSQAIPIRYNLPNYKPLGSFNFLPRWARSTRFSYSINGSFSDNQSLLFNPIEINDDSTFIDTTFRYSSQRKIEHRPSFNISPKFGYFTLNPSFNIAVNNYFRRITRRFNPDDSTTYDEYQNGFFSEYNYNLSLGFNTVLYGIIDNKRPLFYLIKPEDIGFKAFRHTYRPNISLQFRPDLSSPDNGFYDTYYNEEINQEITYSRFIADGGGLASTRRTMSINYSDNHMFEMKVAKSDTSDKDENYELLNLGFSLGYNFVADSLNFSDISMSFRTPAIDFLRFSGSASFTMYDETFSNVIDPFTGRVTTGFAKVDQFLWDNGKGFLRMTNFSINASTSFSSEGISLKSQFGQENEDENKEEKESKLGQRFRVRNDMPDEKHLYGDDIEGYTPFNIPWDVNLNLNYNYGMPNQSRFSRRETLFLRARLNFSLSNTLKISANAGIDLLTGDVRTPNIDVSKDLHCWNLTFNWVPTGFNRGFYLRFGIKASQLNDLKLEKEDNPLLR